MKYRKIEIDGSYTDEKLELVLMQIARWHNLTPKLWRPDYKASTADIEETVQRILNTKKKNYFLPLQKMNRGICKDSYGHINKKNLKVLL
ncbi:hypothetical protein ACF3M2_20725 [Tissierella carlieri]|uniref:hypothetical protein n=1 Tax=Tissierella carlieri TaxID=689904 RepID=UPI00386F8159